MTKANGGDDKVRAWSRLYLVPGMGHCAGGPETLDSFDALGAMVRWVEQGVAPESLTATGRDFFPAAAARFVRIRCTRSTKEAATPKMRQTSSAANSQTRKESL